MMIFYSIALCKENDSLSGKWFMKYFVGGCCDTLNRYNNNNCNEIYEITKDSVFIFSSFRGDYRQLRYLRKNWFCTKMDDSECPTKVISNGFIVNWGDANKIFIKYKGVVPPKNWPKQLK